MIAKAIANLRKFSESIDNSQPVQIPAAMAPGDMLPQGDIGLLMLDKLRRNLEQLPWAEERDYQLAPGQTKGSRHTIPSKYRQVITLYRVDDGDPLSDLIIEADAPFDLEHPDHANHLGYPPGVYRVRHQQNAQRERVLD